jgi:hypothetical protein
VWRRCRGREDGDNRERRADGDPARHRDELAQEPLATIAPELITDCVAYVPFAADTGNFFMNAIWDIAERDLTKLAAVCEEMGHTDPAGLQRISDERKAVDAYFASFTTVPGAAPAPPTATTVPGATPACAPGQALGPTGFCEPVTP